MIEEAFVGFAEIALLAETVFVEGGPVLHAAAAADGQMPANQAFVTKIFLGLCKGPLFAAGRQLLYRRLEDVAQSPFRLDEEIAAEGVARVLDDNILTALLIERADRMSAGDIVGQHGVEIANAQVSRPIVDPAIEQPTQKFAILLRRDREIGDLTRSRIDLHARNELHEFHTESDEKIEYLVGMLRIPRVQQGQGIELDLVFFAVVDGPHHLIERPRARMIETVVVVEFFGAVDTDADEELVFVEEAAPCFVEQDGVGLKRIADFLARSAVLFLQLDGLFIKIQAHQRRLAPLPGKAG